MDNDSFQYLSVARNLLEGNGLSTSLLYYDEHFVSGRLPAPQTVFPPGYSLLIAGLGKMGVPLEAAGYGVSVACYVLVIPLFLWGARLLRVRGPALGLLLVLLVGNAAGWVYALSVLSESLFTAVSLAAVVVLMRAASGPEAPGSGAGRLVVLGGLLAGLACWVRYAGLFLVGAAGLYYALRFLRRRTGPAFRDLLLLAGACLVPVAVLLGRNVLLSGSWQGGNTRPVNKPWPDVLDDVKNALAGLFWGRSTTDGDGFFLGTIGTATQVTAVVLALLGVYALFCRRSVVAGLMRPPGLLLATYLLAYAAAMLYCGKYTAITLADPRMFYPVLPILLLLAGAAFPRGEDSAARARMRPAVVALLLLAGSAYPVAQVRSALRESLTAGPQEGGTPSAGEEPLGRWLDRHLGRAEPVIANDGQAFGYYHDRKTIGLASLTYSRESWSEARLRQVASAYGARFLVLFPDSGDFRVVAAESPFLRTLLDDGRRPAWVVPVARRRGCRLYRLRPDP
jgi:hypothetical protein